MQLLMVLGYLGSGKTTFISNVLKSFEGQKNAVLVNDFGERDVDGKLLEDKGGTIEKIYDGSIFCSCKSDKFVESMVKLVKSKPDNIIVEASGLANPYTMLRELELIEAEGNTKFNLNVFCLVDSTNFEKMLSICHAIKVQTAVSDVVVVNKTDLASKVTTERVINLLGELTNGKIIQTTNAKLDSYFGYPVCEKPKVQLIEDLLLQKILLKVKPTTKEMLDKASEEISHVSNRIKGVVSIDNKNYVYEYIDGKSTLTATDETETFLVVLSCFKRLLKKDIQQIIKDYSFLEI